MVIEGEEKSLYRHPVAPRWRSPRRDQVAIPLVSARYAPDFVVHPKSIPKLGRLTVREVRFWFAHR
jgi:hypothetical protein